MQKVNELWGEDFLERPGRESIGIPVCKKKYTPFRAVVVQNDKHHNSFRVERMFACSIHHELRKKTIQKHGLRKGWEPFGQWSRKKAEQAAKKLYEKHERMSRQHTTATASSEEDTTSTTSSLYAACSLVDSTTHTSTSIGNHNSNYHTKGILCANGECTWSLKSAYDDVYKEITGISDDEM